MESEGQISLKCVLHTDKTVDPTENVIPFTTDSIQICHDKKSIRDKKKKRKSKFDKIVLPTEVDESSGYHARCYKYFCSVNEPKPQNHVEPEIPLNDQSAHNEPIGSNEVNAEQTPLSAPAMHMNDEVIINEVQASSFEQILNSDSERSNAPEEDPMWEDVLDIPKVCIFCDRKLRKRKGINHSTCTVTHLSKKAHIANIFSALDMTEKSKKCENENYIFSYHPCCLGEFEYKFLKHQSPKKCLSGHSTKSDWANLRSIHSNALTQLEQTVIIPLIEGDEVNSLIDIHHLYTAMFEEEKVQKEPQSLETTYNPQHLLQKLLLKFPSLTKTVIKNRTYLHKKDLTHEHIQAKIAEKGDDWAQKIRETAYYIRKKVIGMAPRTLPKNNITLQDVLNGECDIPDELNLLMTCLLKGPNGSLSSSKEKRITSICSSIIFSMSNGSIKPALCLQLGLSTKSLTGSRKMLNILNRLGHCISYTVTEEIETELAYGRSLENRTLPYGLEMEPELRTHVAFDNFDRYVETSSGKDTLHDTVGIVFQNNITKNPSANSNVREHVPRTSTLQSTTRRRQYLSNFNSSVEPYYKGNNRLQHLVGSLPEVPTNLQSVFHINNLWMLHHCYEPQYGKRWFAWYSERMIDQNPTQSIGYLPNLNMSPTCDSVVRKTLQIAQNIAEECKQNHIIVTYDLAIAMKAYRIKADLTPEFDNVFVNLGAFHTMMSFFKAIGKYIDCSGITQILIDSGLIAEGSVTGLLSGTHFNRCKRIHPAAALAFKLLHFKAFWRSYDKQTHDSRLDLSEVIDILKNDRTKAGSTETTLFELNDVLQHYDSYSNQTMNGEHGQTGKYVLFYIWFVELYQHLERAIRSSDLKLYIYTAYQMCGLFFAMNHQNYARWLTKNLDELMNIDLTHPGLSTEFENGGLSIRRTTKKFCRTAVDLTLEQTINANAANKLTGISAFTNSLNARQKWSETHSIRTALITELLQFLGLAKSSDNENEYQSSVFRKQLACFCEEVGNKINPFDDNLNQSKLFNLSTGKAASTATSEFLLHAHSNGMKQMKTFIQECQLDPSRFDRAIKRNTINNFSTEIHKSKKSSKRINATKTERNILGQVLCLALERKIDLAMLLSYPLTTVPYSLANFDGSMITNCQRGEITALFKSKIENQNSICPLNFEVEIIDGFYFLKGLRGSPTKYGIFAKFVLERICDTIGQEIHVIFDKHQSPSPRDPITKKFKELYDNVSTNFSIKGASQERTSSLVNCMNHNSFREELVRFMLDYWREDIECRTIIGDKRVFVSFGEKCYLFAHGFERGKEVSSFENNHFEVESKIILHLNKVKANNIRIQTANPDTLLIYLLYHMQFWTHEKEIWIQSGDVNRNTVLQMNVGQVFKTLTPVFINALPAWYVFTGFEYEPSFYGKGRKTCLKFLEKNRQAQIAFGNIGSEIQFIEDDNINAIEEFTCCLYSSKSKSVNDARLSIFQNAYGLKNPADFHKNGVDFKSMPPCKKVLLKKINRTRYLSQMIKNSTKNIIEKPKDGWLVNENDEMEIDYFADNAYPNVVDEIQIRDEEDDTEDDENGYISSSDEDEYHNEGSDDEWIPKQ